jgi:hypothetical protein
MKPILVPTSGVGNWKQLLAQPVKHWKTGYSARALAHAWEAAGGLPKEIRELLKPLGNVELLFAIPEYKVPLPGGDRASQNDVFALLRTEEGLVATMIEGKVAESFGPTLEEWRRAGSSGKQERLSYLCAQLGIAEQFPPGLRYQLFHRAASAVIEAQRFHAHQAALIVHSFSADDASFPDFRAFVGLFGKTTKAGELVELSTTCGVRLWAGWATGNRKYLKM